MKKILLVEDDASLCRGISFKLKKEGYEVLTSPTVKDAIVIFENNKIDLVISDITLEDGDGYELCQKIRQNSDVLFIFLTALDQEVDMVTGYDLGADDYITKPFSVRELIARVKANLRKAESKIISVEEEKNAESTSEENEIIQIGELQIDLNKFEVKVRGNIIDLTIREFEVLKYLANQPGQVVTREALLEKVWGYEYYGDIRTVDVTIRRIREKIEIDTSSPKILITKRGVGYYLSSK